MFGFWEVFPVSNVSLNSMTWTIQDLLGGWDAVVAFVYLGGASDPAFMARV